MDIGEIKTSHKFFCQNKSKDEIFLKTAKLNLSYL